MSESFTHKHAYREIALSTHLLTGKVTVSWGGGLNTGMEVGWMIDDRRRCERTKGGTLSLWYPVRTPVRMSDTAEAAHMPPIYFPFLLFSILNQE